MTHDELTGRINDVDSHEQIMLSHWEETFGEIGAQVCNHATHWFGQILADAEEAQEYVEVEVEKTPIDEETLRTVRGSAAPGAMSFDRRIQVMDLLGIQRQLVFPFFGF